MSMKSKLKILALLLGFGFSLHALGHDWSLGERGGKTVVHSRNTAKKAVHEVESSPSSPRICKVEERGEFEIVVYFWAETGSGRGLSTTWNGAVYDRKNDKFLGFSVFGRFLDGGCSGAQPDSEQPLWEYSSDGKTLRVEDPSTGFVDNYTID